MFEFIEHYISGNILKDLQNRRVVCWNNNKPEHLRIVKGRYSSFQVPKFITKINYPPNSERDYSISVYVHYIEYQVKKHIDKNKIKIKTLEDYEIIYNMVLDRENIKSEVERFYNNYLRRKNFESELYTIKSKRKGKVSNGND